MRYTGEQRALPVYTGTTYQERPQPHSHLRVEDQRQTCSKAFKSLPQHKNDSVVIPNKFQFALCGNVIVGILLAFDISGVFGNIEHEQVEQSQRDEHPCFLNGRSKHGAPPFQSP